MMNEESYNPVAKAIGKVTEDLIRVATSEGSRADRQAEEREKESADFASRERQLKSDVVTTEGHRSHLLRKMTEIQGLLSAARERLMKIQKTRPGPGNRTNLQKAMMELPIAWNQIDRCLSKAEAAIKYQDPPMR